MQLHFQYGAKTPGIEARNDVLSLSLTNSAFAKAAECWSLPEESRYRRCGDFHRLESHDHLLGAASLEVCPDTLTAVTESLYEQLLSAHPEFPLYRIWHFLPAINQRREGGLESYQAFCLGRANAFERHAGDEFHSKTPAASAVGTQGGHLSLVYLAGRPLATHLENPRQTPAYHYPEQYGPKPPVFARATCVDSPGRPMLFVSGTSSVLASESIGDTIESQLATTLDNLHTIAAQSPVAVTGRRRVRIYLRHAEDYAYVKGQLEAHYLNEGDEAYYIQAEICRRELLVEIEATIGL